jgi:hypothetical protein
MQPHKLLTPFRVVAVALCLLAGSTQVASAALVDWAEGTWEFGGPSVTGWVAPSSSQIAEASAYTGSTLAGFVGASWYTAGSAVASHGGLGGIQPRLSTTFNGGQGTLGVLSVGANNDSNGDDPSVAPANYVILTLTFANPVDVTRFVIGDVDRGGSTSWEDFIAVEGKLWGSGVGTVYGTAAGNNETLTFGSLAGVHGTASVSNGTTDGNVSVGFSGAVDEISFYFMQGPITGSSQHGVWIEDIEFSEVPEPRAGMLVAVGLLLVGIGRVFRKPA